jgi:type VI secretion system protein ImpC
MPRPPSFAQVEIETGERSAPVQRSEPDAPFHIAILGDFTGRENRAQIDPTFVARQPVLIDRDNYDEVLAQFAPELRLPLGGPDGPRVPIAFRELDDFHPDRIFDRLKIFQALRETREGLHDPARFEAAAEEVRSWSGIAKPRSPTTQVSRPPARDLLEQALTATESKRGEASADRGRDDFQALLHDIVAPFIEAKPDPQRPELVAQVDAAISGQMRALLHHPDFQALEAAWRAVFFLVRRLTTDANLKVFLLDIAKPELAADLAATYKFLIQGVPDAQPWAVLAGNYSFDRTDEDLQLLGRMAAVARQAGAPFLAAALPRVLGCDSFADAPDPRDWRPAGSAVQSWDALRGLPQASWLGLALPRFLLRLPYGIETDAAEHFAFEEFGLVPRHEDYLWGNAAFACAYLLGEAFSESGWHLRPGEVREIGGLPLHVYRAGGESSLKPCAEALLTDRAVEAILDRGLMALVSMSDSVRLVRFQSLAHPAAALLGRWS